MDIPFKCWPPLEAYAKLFPSKQFPGLFYYDYDQKSKPDNPVLILIHGLGDEADTWRHLIPLLGAAGYRILAPDMPGFGRSLVPRRSGIGSQRDAVLELAETVSKNSQRGVILIGSSMGAAVAEAAVLAEYALQERQNKKKLPNNDGLPPKPLPRIKALILLNGCFPVESTGTSKLIFSALPFVGKKWYRSFRADPERAWRSLFSYYADIHSLHEEDKDFLRTRVMDRVFSRSQERAYFSTLRSMIFQSMRSSHYLRIGSWPRKIALIWGEKDQILPKTLTESFIKLRGNSPTEVSIIPDAGHLPHQEKPEETAKAILVFIKTLELVKNSVS